MPCARPARQVVASSTLGRRCGLMSSRNDPGPVIGLMLAAIALLLMLLV
jgi:hypothetical protein